MSHVQKASVSRLQRVWKVGWLWCGALQLCRPDTHLRASGEFGVREGLQRRLMPRRFFVLRSRECTGSRQRVLAEWLIYWSGVRERKRLPRVTDAGLRPGQQCEVRGRL